MFPVLKTPSDQLDTNTEGSQDRAFRKGRGAVTATWEETRALRRGIQEKSVVRSGPEGPLASATWSFLFNRWRQKLDPD